MIATLIHVSYMYICSTHWFFLLRVVVFTHFIKFIVFFVANFPLLMKKLCRSNLLIVTKCGNCICSSFSFMPFLLNSKETFYGNSKETFC